MHPAHAGKSAAHTHPACAFGAEQTTSRPTRGCGLTPREWPRASRCGAPRRQRFGVPDDVLTGIQAWCRPQVPASSGWRVRILRSGTRAIQHRRRVFDVAGVQVGLGHAGGVESLAPGAGVIEPLKGRFQLGYRAEGTPQFRPDAAGHDPNFVVIDPCGPVRRGTEPGVVEGTVRRVQGTRGFFLIAGDRVGEREPLKKAGRARRPAVAASPARRDPSGRRAVGVRPRPTPRW